MTTLNVYLDSAGTTCWATEFYQSNFEGKLDITTFGDMHVPDQPEGGIMHSILSALPGFSLMASDGMDGGAKYDEFCLGLRGGDVEGLRGDFEKLSDGADVFTQHAKQMRDNELGMLKDKFGIKWMVNIKESAKEG